MRYLCKPLGAVCSVLAALATLGCSADEMTRPHDPGSAAPTPRQLPTLLSNAPPLIIDFESVSQSNTWCVSGFSGLLSNQVFPEDVQFDLSWTAGVNRFTPGGCLNVTNEPSPVTTAFLLPGRSSGRIHIPPDAADQYAGKVGLWYSSDAALGLDVFFEDGTHESASFPPTEPIGTGLFGRWQEATYDGGGRKIRDLVVTGVGGRTVIDNLTITRLTSDGDGDGLPDGEDNCPAEPNTDQTDTDGDGLGAPCDIDDDQDGLSDSVDNCPLIGNPDQADWDHDHQGDFCDSDDDNDGTEDESDSCSINSPIDSNGDGIGDACKALPTYSFSGFRPPVDQPAVAVNKAKASSAIPVKFSLGGDKTLDIFNGGFPRPVPYACVAGAAVDAIETTVSASLSSLGYDAANDQYTYTWKTDKRWAGQCIRLHLGLKDGSDHYAEFQFIR
jgi:hypothetical protein